MTFYFHLLSLLLVPAVLSQIVVMPPNPDIGNPVTASCTGDLASVPIWSFSMSGNDFINVSEIPAYQLTNSTTANNMTVSWAIEFQLNTAGRYMCLYSENGTAVNMTITLSTGIIPSDYSRDVEVEEDTASFAIECTFQIAPPPVGPRATWCYEAYTFPNLAEDCTSLLNNTYLSLIPSFQNFTATNVYVSRLEIRNVLTTNAGQYKCVIYAAGANYTGDVRLRVRQRLEPLWPAIGIMIQLVIVAICIALHYLWDYYKEQQEKKKIIEKAEQNLVTSPLEGPIETEQSNDLLIKVVPT